MEDGTNDITDITAWLRQWLDNEPHATAASKAVPTIG